MAEDVASAIDFSDLDQACAWVTHTVASRPWRPRFFAAFVAELQRAFPHPFDVAELGSGPGHLAAAILGACRVRSYLALDLSPAMHHIAREHLVERSGAARFVVADFSKPEWIDAIGAVDAVVTMQAAHEVRHKTRIPALLAQMYGVIRPGGLLLFCDHFAEAGTGKNEALYPMREQQPLLLAQAGFDPIRLVHEEGGMALYAAVRPI